MRRASMVLGTLLIALAVPLGALAGTQVPLKGADEGTWGQGSHNCGSLFPVFVETSGVASQVGRYAYSSQECVDFGDATFEGQFEMTAANGDTIVGSTYAGTFTVVDTTIHYEQDNAVGGGTGRFAGAAGSFHISGLAFDDSSAVQVLVGAISRVGSS